jgi:hypothetical protein
MILSFIVFALNGQPRSTKSQQMSKASKVHRRPHVLPYPIEHSDRSCKYPSSKACPLLFSQQSNASSPPRDAREENAGKCSLRLLKCFCSLGLDSICVSARRDKLDAARIATSARLRRRFTERKQVRPRDAFTNGTGFISIWVQSIMTTRNMTWKDFPFSA